MPLEIYNAMNLARYGKASTRRRLLPERKKWGLMTLIFKESRKISRPVEVNRDKDTSRD